MKIFRAIQISLKELHRPDHLTRIISSQYPDVSSEISPCEYKVTPKAKSKDKSKTSKMNKLFKSLRRFSATGHRKASAINTNPLSGCTFDASNDSFQTPVLVPARQNSSYHRECGAQRRSCELFDKVNGVAVNELSVPLTIDSLLETARSFTANEGTTLVSCDERQDLKSIKDGIESIQPELLRMISPKIATKMVIEEMLRIVSSKTRDLMLLKIAKQEGRRWSTTSASFMEGTLPSYDYTAQEFAKKLQSMLYVNDNPNCYSENSDICGIGNDFSSRNLLAMRSMLTYKPKRSHFTDLQCYVQASNYHTLKSIENNQCPEHFSMLPAGLSRNSRLVTRSKLQAKKLHCSRQMGNANKNIDEEWYMHSKRIANNDIDAPRGSGLVLVSGETASVQALDHNEVISSHETRFPGRDAPKLALMASVSSTGHPQVAYDTIGNSTLSSKSDAKQQAEKSNVESSSLGQESVTTNASDKNAMSFRSTLSPEFVRPRMTNFEFHFDEEDTPHVAMLYSFCAPLPAEAYRENIIPIRVVDGREQTIGAARSASNDDKQGLLKNILDKLNLLKW